MVKQLRVVILGATGAVGSNAFAALQADTRISQITVLVRRPIEGLSDGKMTEHVVDVLDPSSYSHFLSGHDAAVCTFGVGQPTKVSRDEFTAVDFDAVLDFAKACKAQGVKHFELLGAVAADPASRSFYLKSKGALREAIAALGFARFSIFQPSMLLTSSNRYGFSQALLLALWPGVSKVMLGSLAKYRGIRVENLGHAMAANLFLPGAGVEVLEWPEFRRILQQG